jgi:hypothetical protein
VRRRLEPGERAGTTAQLQAARADLPAVPASPAATRASWRGGRATTAATTGTADTPRVRCAFARVWRMAQARVPADP